VDPRIISQYKRQGVPRCMGMLARLLFFKSKMEEGTSKNPIGRKSEGRGCEK
jgi:hypothetical protein